MNYEKYLPIGSVVMLKNGTKRLMVTGYGIMPNDDETKIYDYCGCLFPEGVIDTEEVAVFNHEQIDKVYCIGFKDEEQEKFMQELKGNLANQGASIG